MVRSASLREPSKGVQEGLTEAVSFKCGLEDSCMGHRFIEFLL